MPVGGPAFSSVRKAREALKERAYEIYITYLDGMKMALAAGDYETFQKGMQYLMAHIPKDEDGLAMLEMDVDKPKQVEGGPKGPVIQIGFKLGGLNHEEPAALPEATIIDVKPEP